jgi:hypothetical protein
MRTTIRLDDELLAASKALAARTGRTLTKVIEDALRQSLARRPDEEGEPVRLPTFAGKGLRPGLDLDDSSGLIDVMEDRARP